MNNVYAHSRFYTHAHTHTLDISIFFLWNKYNNVLIMVHSKGFYFLCAFLYYSVLQMQILLSNQNKYQYVF